MRLLLVSVISLLISGLLWGFLYLRGLQAPLSEYKHPLFEKAKPWIAVDWQIAKESTNHSIVYFQISQSKEGKLSVVGAGSESPGELLRTYPKKFLLLELMDNLESIDQKLFAELPTDHEERVLFISKHNVLTRTIKESQPLWLLGNSSADMTRLLVLDALFLLPAYSYRGDFFLTKLRDHKNLFINTAIREEFKRRALPLLLGPFSSDEELKEALDFHPDGVLIDRLEQLQLVLSP